MPSLEASLVEHAGEEQIDWGGAHLGHEHLLCLLLRHLSFLLIFIRYLSYLVLRHKLLHCHHLVELEVDVGHVLLVHDSVEHFVEEDKAVVRDGQLHLEDDLVDLTDIGVIENSKFTPHAVRQLLQETWHVLWLDFGALVALSLLLPSFHEIFIINLKARQRVVVLDIVPCKVLNDDENEQVQHDIGDDHDESEEEDGSDR